MTDEKLDEYLRTRPFEVQRDDDTEETLSEHDTKEEALVAAKTEWRGERVKVVTTKTGDAFWWSHEVDDEY